MTAETLADNENNGIPFAQCSLQNDVGLNFETIIGYVVKLFFYYLGYEA